jgi:hypothetical protein
MITLVPGLCGLNVALLATLAYIATQPIQSLPSNHSEPSVAVQPPRADGAGYMRMPVAANHKVAHVFAAPSILPRTESETSSAPSPPAAQLRLVGVIYADSGSVALVTNGTPAGVTRLLVGGTVDGWQLTDIHRTAVQLTRKGHVRTLRLDHHL